MDIYNLTNKPSSNNELNIHSQHLARKYSTIWRMNIARRHAAYKPFNLIGYTTWINTVDVYDGDTIKALMCYRGKIDQWTIRMNGYDSPEMKPLKSKQNRDKEIEAAKRAKTALEEWVLGRPTFAKIVGFDKYGRLLAELYNGKIHLNNWMIKNGHGYPYSGGKKENTDYN